MRRRAPHRAPTVTWRGLHPLALQVSTGRWTPAGGSRDVTPCPGRRGERRCPAGPAPGSFPVPAALAAGWGGGSAVPGLGTPFGGCGMRGERAHRHCYRHPESRGGQRLGLAKTCNRLRVSINERVWRASLGFHRPFGKLSSVFDFKYF